MVSTFQIMKRDQIKPAFSPVFEVFFFPADKSVVFLDEYPLTFFSITKTQQYDLTEMIDGKTSITKLAHKMAHCLSAQQVRDILDQWHQKKLVVFY